jgi:hypothetical protein
VQVYLSLYRFMCNILDYFKFKKSKKFEFLIVFEDAFDSLLEHVLMMTSLLTRQLSMSTSVASYALHTPLFKNKIFRVQDSNPHLRWCWF